MNEALVLLGSNEGDSFGNIQHAVNLLQAHGLEIITCSKVYRTAAWGNTNQPDFLNAVITILCSQSPEELLELLLATEQKMGRTRNSLKWQPRIIDLDMLYFNDAIVNTEKLVIPHPWLHARKFTLIPLCDVAPHVEHPLLKQTNKQLLQLCSDELDVELTQNYILI